MALSMWGFSLLRGVFCFAPLLPGHEGRAPQQECRHASGTRAGPAVAEPL